MKGLQYFWPTNDDGVRVDVEQDTTVKKIIKASLGLNRDCAHGMTIYNALRELLSNMIDGIVDTNGESFVGLKISQREKRGDTQVYTIHNDKFIFGEILDSPTKLSFANFGPIIETFEQIVQIGASKKREKKNQGGQHGEGLKRAVVRLLNAGCEKVEVYFAMTENDFTDFRHMTFSIGRDKCLCYSMASHNLKERFAGANDYHRFEVVFKKPDNFPDFNIDEYMITDGIRGARDENDPGMVLPMEESGNIYIWHFLVVKYEHIQFGYDFFLRKITRDRDNINGDLLVKCIAKVWNASVLESESLAKLFYDQVVMDSTRRDISTFEHDALFQMSKLAATRLFEIFRAQEKRTPVRESDMFKLVTKYQKKDFVVIPDHAVSLFEMVLGTFDQQVKEMDVDFLTQYASAKLNEEFSSVLQISQIEDIWIVDAPLSSVNYYFCPQTRIFSVNSRDGSVVAPNGQVIDRERFLNVLLFRYLPDVFEEDDDFNGMSIINKLAPPAPVAPSASLPVPSALSPSSSIVEIRIPVDDEPDNESDSIAVESRKRGRNNSPAAVASNLKKAKESAPPPGFKYYDGPRLLVKL